MMKEVWTDWKASVRLALMERAAVWYFRLSGFYETGVSRGREQGNRGEGKRARVTEEGGEIRGAP